VVGVVVRARVSAKLRCLGLTAAIEICGGCGGSQLFAGERSGVLLSCFGLGVGVGFGFGWG